MMNSKYWAMTSPENPNNTPHETMTFLYFNGAVFPVYGLPAVECSCGHRWINCSAPFECPEKIRRHPNILDGWPISIAAFKQLRTEVLWELKNQGIVYNKKTMDSWEWMVPGINFQPYEFRIATKPQFSFHWAAINRRYVVVKPEVKDCFEMTGINGVSFHKVNITFVGNGPTDHYQPNTEVPGWYEEPDLEPPYINRVEPEDDPESFGPLYLMRVDHSGPDWRNYDIRCPECGIYSDDTLKPKDQAIRKSNLLPEYDVFHTNLTNEVIVTDRVYQLMHDCKFTNLPTFRELDIS